MIFYLFGMYVSITDYQKVKFFNTNLQFNLIEKENLEK